jgi:hypothetical protein
LDKYQTPDSEHQQNWFEIVKNAYWLLYLSRYDGDDNLRKWEKYLPKNNNQDVKEPEKNAVKSPTQTQRAMTGIISEFAKEYLIPKPRNNKSGRKKGDKQTPRTRFAVVKKGKKTSELSSA